MLGDAKTLWQTASSIVNKAREGLSKTIESLDLDAQQGSINEELAAELEKWKLMLEDSQMQQFELSKQTRSILAEKEAEIKVLKMQASATDATLVDPLTFSAMTEIEKIKSEKEALAASLTAAEGKLKESLRERNEAQIAVKKIGDLRSRYEALAAEHATLTMESESRDKSKTETVDNLVSEYSHLASEFEIKTQQDATRITELARYNEILTTKMKAMEHSISELAERATTTTSSKGGNSGSGGLVVETGSDPSQNQLKESRAKMASLQFDLKGKDDTIAQLRAELSAAEQRGKDDKGLKSDASRPATTTASDADLNSLKAELKEATKAIATSRAELESVKNDNSRLIDESAQAREAGKGFLEQLKTLQREYEEYKKTAVGELATAVASEAARLSSTEREQHKATSAAALAAATNEARRSMEATEASLRRQIDSLSAEHASNVAAIKADHAIALETLKKKADDELAIAISNLRAEHAATVTRLGKEATAQALLHESAIATLKADLEASASSRVEAAKSAADQARASLEASHASSIEALKVESEASAVARIADLQKAADEARTTLEKAQAAAIESLKSELEASALSRIAAVQTAADQACVALEASHTSAIESLKSDLESSALSRLAAAQLAAETAQAAALDALQQKADVLLASTTDALKAEHTQLIENAKRKAEEKLEKLVAARAAATEKLKVELEEDALTRLAAAKQIADGKIAAAEAARDKSLWEQAHVEERYEQKMKDALAAAEAKFKADLQQYIEMYSLERQRRKAIHNKLLELQGNIRVVCRVRPVLEVERRQAAGEEVDVTEFPNEEDIVITRDPVTKTKFEYDRVFAPGSTQAAVFDHVSPLCTSVLDGYHVCIFAYGQTGSGKTFTMEGSRDDRGVSPRAVAEIFRVVHDAPAEWTYKLTFSMLEIYNESILDLLDASGAKEKLEIRQGDGKSGNVVAGLIEIEVTSDNQVFELMARGQSNRAVGAHDMNEHSSRSHSILTITAKGKNSLDGTSTSGKLHLIDLAGSERISKTDATGDRLKEAQNINKSLSALGDVIGALGNKKNTHVPYRNSKLTFLLQDSLGGTSKVLMFVNISPAVYNLGETVCSLNFASRCRATELGQAKRNEVAGGGEAKKPAPSTSTSSSSLKSAR